MRTTTLQAVQPRVLRHQVLDALRTAILANEIEAGTHLQETVLAERMGVSRAPVREAIRQLEQEGLIEFFPHKGAVVIGLPTDQIEAIYEMRAVIEGRAIARTCTTATSEDVMAMRSIVDEMAAAVGRGDIPTLADADWRFHDLIVRLSGYDLLRRIWSSLDGLVRVRTYQALGGPGEASGYFIRESANSHSRLIGAIETKDEPLAIDLITDHVLGVARRMRGDDNMGLLSGR